MDRFETVKAAMSDHAVLVYPEEACGLVVEAGGALHYLPCQNKATKPKRGFAMAPEDYADAEDFGTVVALFHSHPGGRSIASEADKVMAGLLDVPVWLVCSLGMQADGKTGVDNWTAYERVAGYRSPLLGREFVHGLHDCYGLIRDWYEEERGVALPDFPRSDLWWEDKDGPSMYVENYAKAGFVDMGRDEVPQHGDVLLLTYLSKHGKPNHAGVYLEGGQFLHHMLGRLSGRNLWGGSWSNSLFTVLRYGGKDGGGNAPND